MIRLTHAQFLLEKAVSLAEELGRAISVSIVDAAGVEVAGIRMDGASWFTLGVARDKAQTAAVFGRQSAALQPLWTEHPTLVPLIEKQLAFHPTALAGGVPIADPGDGARVIGAVGVAGALPELDLQIAETLAATELPTA